MALTAKKVYAILKRQISDMEAKLNSPVRYRGTVATADLLPLNPDIGDMYNIESKSVYGEAGMNVAWNGVAWDTMGAPIDMSLYIKSSELADWVKQQNKPTYTAEEVGALPADTKIPSKTSDLQNDSGFLTKIPDNYLSGTDKTLNVSGKAADAKATGDKITELSADISNKLNKNQGSENSGKVAGINEVGDIVPMFPVGVEYNSETNCLEFGSDQKMKLNQGIGLDNTLTKSGSAADAGVTGKKIDSLKEDTNDLILTIGNISKSFEYSNSVNHSSLNDQIKIPINRSENFNVLIVSEDNIPVFIYAYYDNKTDERISVTTTNQDGLNFTAKNNIIAIGVYVGANVNIRSQKITFFVSKTNSYENKFLEIEKSLQPTNQFFNLDKIEFINGYGIDYYTGALIQDETYSYCEIDVSLFRGGQLTGFSGASDSRGLAFYDAEGNFISGVGNSTLSTYDWDINCTIPSNASTTKIHCKTTYQSQFALSLQWDTAKKNITNAINIVDIHENKFLELEENKKKKLNCNARHVLQNHAVHPLALLHFTDIHGDIQALKRILEKASDYDDAICTGDIVDSTYGDITNWWNEKILTCIGNHDTASYNSTNGYNWTYLSMQDRNKYYIKPFESKWGIVHEEGTSYYYKDYPDNHVRLIVIDTMLYMGNGTINEANAQTQWLNTLLNSANTNGLHVVIAEHTVHGGATPVTCSFSRYAQDDMPTYTDCNLPSEIINCVATAITNGLSFIGYICGHTHQDGIWDATGDGTQLMYCATCAAVSYAPQWQNSDQHRSIDLDAFNLVIIDTNRSLVKIIREGGADIDDHMRTRKAICIDYSKGAIVGEIL